MYCIKASRTAVGGLFAEEKYCVRQFGMLYANRNELFLPFQAGDVECKGTVAFLEEFYLYFKGLGL